MTTDGNVSAVLDGDGVVLDANPPFLAMLGPERDGLIGTPLAPRLAAEHLPSIDRYLATRLDGGGPGSWTGTWCGLRTDGLPWSADVDLWTSSPTDGPERIILSGHPRFGPARWAPPPTGEPPPPRAGLDSVVSHDIRGALRSASGFITIVHRLLADPAVDRLDERFSPATEHLAIAARSLAAADELAERVVQLLRWSERPLSMTVHHLPDLISAAVTRSHTTFGGEAAQMRVVGDLPDVVADDEQIEWALAELVTNARKFHHQPGQLGGAPVPMEIGLATADERRAAAYPDDPRFAVLALRDRGIGVAPTLADDAFAPARKLQPRGDYPGVGMGLALCALVFERHAGWCRILTARPGATAVWRVPLAPAASPGGGDRPL